MSRPEGVNESQHASPARPRWLAGGVFVLLLLVVPVYSQFDLGPLIAAFGLINSTLQSSAASPLSALQKMFQQQQQYQQTVVYPLPAILQAQQSAAVLLGSSQQVHGTFSIPRYSAQTPTSQQFEQTLLSGDPNQVGNVSALYPQVYGPLPSTQAASPQVINAIDMNDAEAQDAFKKAAQLDAMASVQLQVSQNLLQQLQTAPPGSASLLTAQASAWILQGNAYSQSAMAELLRARTAALATTGLVYKTAATSSQNMNGVIPNLQQTGR